LPLLIEYSDVFALDEVPAMTLVSVGMRLAIAAMLAAVLPSMGCRPADGNGQTASVSDTTPDSATSASASDRVGTNGRFADVNGLKMYYEIHGTGKPIVLLHGAFSQIRTDFSQMVPLWAKHRQVIAIEQQGHGHTADIDRSLTYRQMGDDVAALLKQLNIANTDFFGYSMGGGVALDIAIHHPELVNKLVDMGGAMYRSSGFHPELMRMESTMTADMMKDTPWKASYDSVAPNKADFPKLVERIKKLDTTFPGWSASEIKGIKAPVLLIVGDADAVRLEHVVEFFHLLGGGVEGDLNPIPASQLAVLPGTNHQMMVARTDWLVSMTNAFLDRPSPPTAAPKPR
jgi:pimeloyl-ACP methyl ester carboxylesterase